MELVLNLRPQAAAHHPQPAQERAPLVAPRSCHRGEEANGSIMVLPS